MSWGLKRLSQTGASLSGILERLQLSQREYGLRLKGRKLAGGANFFFFPSTPPSSVAGGVEELFRAMGF